jgi:hypothetical protein
MYTIRVSDHDGPDTSTRMSFVRLATSLGYQVSGSFGLPDLEDVKRVFAAITLIYETSVGAARYDAITAIWKLASEAYGLDMVPMTFDEKQSPDENTETFYSAFIAAYGALVLALDVMSFDPNG